ncbi:hypothetical protein [Terrarubrum flagellatum]|uniref:hypothetical protein n=1 Tax=Terrirubrum flagellatum TaxID=2895980 RepID=UPI003144DB3D
MPSTQLPPKPDFAAIEAAAPESVDRRTLILALIGNLICSWSNNESMLIYVLMMLLRTDQASAAIVFATLNTTRARLDLIQRLALLHLKDKALDRDLKKLIARFNDSTRLRNEFNHCIYSVDDHGKITQTQSMRIVETRTSLQFGETRQMDEQRIKEMLDANRSLTQLNRELWDILPRLQAHLNSKT